MCAVRRQTYKGYVKIFALFRTSSEKCDARLSPRITTFLSSRRQYGTATDVNQSVKQTLSTNLTSIYYILHLAIHLKSIDREGVQMGTPHMDPTIFLMQYQQTL